MKQLVHHLCFADFSARKNQQIHPKRLDILEECQLTDHAQMTLVTNMGIEPDI